MKPLSAGFVIKLMAREALSIRELWKLDVAQKEAEAMESIKNPVIRDMTPEELEEEVTHEQG